jgi:hypothetical protein
MNHKPSLTIPAFLEPVRSSEGLPRIKQPKGWPGTKPGHEIWAALRPEKKGGQLCVLGELEVGIQSMAMQQEPRKTGGTTKILLRSTF